MGDLSPAFGTEEGVKVLADYYSGIGLYGFNAGQKSFGLNIQIVLAIPVRKHIALRRLKMEIVM